jgi:hypothetical protein
MMVPEIRPHDDLFAAPYSRGVRNVFPEIPSPASCGLHQFEVALSQIGPRERWG